MCGWSSGIVIRLVAVSVFYLNLLCGTFLFLFFCVKEEQRCQEKMEQDQREKDH